jgi:hypothetical protein
MAIERAPLPRTALHVARTATAPVALSTLAFTGVCCVFLVPVFLHALGSAYLRIAGAEPARLQPASIGLLGAPLFLVPLAAYWAGSALHESASEVLLSAEHAVLVVGIAALLGAILKPLFGAPFAAAGSDLDLLESLLASGAHDSRRGLLHNLGIGAIVGAIQGSPALVVVVARSVAWGASGLVSVALLVFAGIVAAHIAAIAIVKHERDATIEARGEGDTRRARFALRESGRLVGSLSVAVSSTCLLGLVVALAVVTPLGAWRSVPRTADDGRGPALVPGEPRSVIWLDGLTARGLDDRWEVHSGSSITTTVTLPFGDPSRARARREVLDGREVWTLCTPSRREVRCFSVDDAGVRVDDTTYDRIAVRVGGRAGVLVLMASTFALMALFVIQVRRAGIAAGLDGPRFTGARETTALAGTLRTPVPVTITGDAISVNEPARIDLGPWGSVLLAPGRHPLIVPSEPGSLRDGAALTIVAPLRGAHGSPFRDGTPPLPAGSRLAIGALDEAREQYAERVARTNTLASLPLLAVALGLATLIVASL